jgi:hypothetical protein
MNRHPERSEGSLRFLVALILACCSGIAEANWTANVGYQNPAVSTWGLNLFYIGQSWGFEAGIGWIDANAHVDDDDDDGDGADDGSDDDDDDKASVALAGDIDLKYFLTGGSARLFFQGGFGVGLGATAGDDSGAGAGLGGGFAGLGVLLGSPSMYGYASFNVNGNDDTFVQAGLGVDI